MTCCALLKEKTNEPRIGYDNAPARTRLWDHLLSDDEEILWEGHPEFGFQFSGSAFKTLAIVAIGLYVYGSQIIFASQHGSPLGDMLSIPYIGRINGEVFLAAAVGWTGLWFIMQTTTTPFLCAIC
ncbi:MAG TPA: hypothetical protein EYG79_02230 [Rhodobacteraceae bacterium]|nr:hypothetical protein [Paracoccaceae bacterium]